MKKSLLLLLALTLMSPAFAQSSNCGSISPEIVPVSTISLCDGVSTDALNISLSSNLPNIGYLIVDVEQEADDNMGNAIIAPDDDGMFVPADIQLTYNQRFAIRPFAYDINEFRDFFATIKNTSFNGTTCCIYAEAIAKDFCDDLSINHGLNTAEDINTFENVWAIVNASGGPSGNSFSVEGFAQQIELDMMSNLLHQVCQFDSDYCYAVGNTEQIFEIKEAPSIIDINIDIPHQITINSDISEGILEYSIDPDAGWQTNNTIYDTPTSGIAYVREVSTSCIEERNFFNYSLPLNLSDFKGTNEATTNLLYWTTETEINSLGFGVERSSNGTDFTEVGWVDAAGYSSSSIDYAFRDITPLTGINSYRLAMHDFSGYIDYSPTIIVQRNDVSGFSILSIGPNPSANMISISITNDEPGEVQYLIYDIAGRKARSGTEVLEKGINSFTIDATMMGTGMYVFTAVKGDYVSTYKFVMH